jgi:hypothetical protein
VFVFPPRADARAPPPRNHGGQPRRNRQLLDAGGGACLTRPPPKHPFASHGTLGSASTRSLSTSKSIFWPRAPDHRTSTRWSRTGSTPCGKRLRLALPVAFIPAPILTWRPREQFCAHSCCRSRVASLPPPARRPCVRGGVPPSLETLPMESGSLSPRSSLPLARGAGSWGFSPRGGLLVID